MLMLLRVGICWCCCCYEYLAVAVAGRWTNRSHTNKFRWVSTDNNAAVADSGCADVGGFSWDFHLSVDRFSSNDRPMCLGFRFTQTTHSHFDLHGNFDAMIKYILKFLQLLFQPRVVSSNFPMHKFLGAFFFLAQKYANCWHTTTLMCTKTSGGATASLRCRQCHQASSQLEQV